MENNDHDPVNREGAMAEIKRLRWLTAQLHEQIRCNRLKMEMRDLAFATSLDEARLIQGLLDLVGPALNLSRASFATLPDGTQDGVVRQQWRHGRIFSTLGASLPAHLCTDPRPDTIVEIRRRHSAGSHALPIHGVLDTHGIRSCLLAACGDKQGLKGVFCFSECLDPHRQWSESDKTILADIARVVGTWRENDESRKTAAAEKDELRRQLREARKMEAFGILAGGIAHDFNNILSAVMGHIELAQIELAPDHKAAGSLRESLKHVFRARELVQRILTYTRGEPGEVFPVMLGPMIKESFKLLRSMLPAAIAIEEQIDSRVGPVLADPADIRQMIMDFSLRGFHAMAEAGGTLRVELAEVEIPPGGPSAVNLIPGTYARLRISDTGVAMQRIFDPRVSAARGEGFVLGLGMAHDMIEKMGGTILEESRRGGGSRFDIWIPCRPHRTDPPVVDKTPPAVSTGRELILLVEDDPVLNTLTQKLLQWLGYQVDAHTSPREALDAFVRQPEAYSLLITDWSMPEMNGDRLASSLAKIRPDLPAILCSGYGEEFLAGGGTVAGFHAVLSKPLSLQAVSRAVASALKQKADPAAAP